MVFSSSLMRYLKCYFQKCARINPLHARLLVLLILISSTVVISHYEYGFTAAANHLLELIKGKKLSQFFG